MRAKRVSDLFISLMIKVRISIVKLLDDFTDFVFDMMELVHDQTQIF